MRGSGGMKEGLKHLLLNFLCDFGLGETLQPPCSSFMDISSLDTYWYPT
jgi:hypothetical protein